MHHAGGIGQAAHRYIVVRYLLGLHRDHAVTLKAIVKKRRGVFIFAPLVTAIQHHAQQRKTVLFRPCHRRVLRLARPAQLAALGIGVIIGALHQHMVVGANAAYHIFFVIHGQGVFRRAEVLLKALHAHRPARDARHIIGGGIMVVVRQAVRVGKMGVGKPQRRHLLVHQLREFRQIAAYRLRYRVGAVIGGFHHRPVQRVPQRDDLARLQRQMGRVAPLPYVAYRLLRYGDLILWLGVHQPQRRRQYLGNTGGILLFVHILLQQHLSGLCVHHHIGVTVGLRHLVLGGCGRHRCHRPYHHRRQQQR